jgi:SpoVK/Ycf46/Vps4 family AAA+-type ATPase
MTDVLQKTVAVRSSLRNLAATQLENADASEKEGNIVGSLMYKAGAWSALQGWKKAGEVFGAPSQQATDMSNSIETQIKALIERYKNAVSTQAGSTQAGGTKKKDETEDDAALCARLKTSFENGSKNCEAWFDTVVGLNEAKEALSTNLIAPYLFPNLISNKTKGILLYGPPGTGKTLLVKAAVNELMKDDSMQVMFYAPTAADLKGRYFGESEKLIRNMYDCAEKACLDWEAANKGSGKSAMAIIFIDEVDSVAGRREGAGNENNAITVNALLQKLDGINTGDRITTVAATNFPWNLDTAFLERFDGQILVPLPTAGNITKLLTQKMDDIVRSTLAPKVPSKQELNRQLEAASPADKNRVQQLLDSLYKGGCKKPDRAERFAYSWLKKHREGYFPNIQEGFLSTLGSIMAGDVSFQIDDNGRLTTLNVLRKEDGTITGNKPVGSIVRLSNRQIDKAFGKVRLRMLRRAKEGNVVVKLINPESATIPNSPKHIYLSLDSTHQLQWFQIFSSNVPQQLAFCMDRDLSEDTVIELGGVSMYSSRMLPLVQKKQLAQDASSIKDIYIGFTKETKSTLLGKFIADLAATSKAQVADVRAFFETAMDLNAMVEYVSSSVGDATERYRLLKMMKKAKAEEYITSKHHILVRTAIKITKNDGDANKTLNAIAVLQSTYPALGDKLVLKKFFATPYTRQLQFLGIAETSDQRSKLDALLKPISSTNMFASGDELVSRNEDAYYYYTWECSQENAAKLLGEYEASAQDTISEIVAWTTLWSTFSKLRACSLEIENEWNKDRPVDLQVDNAFAKTTTSLFLFGSTTSTSDDNPMNSRNGNAKRLYIMGKDTDTSLAQKLGGAIKSILGAREEKKDVKKTATTAATYKLDASVPLFTPTLDIEKITLATNEALSWTVESSAAQLVQFQVRNYAYVDTAANKQLTSWNVTQEDFCEVLKQAKPSLSDDELALIYQYSVNPADTTIGQRFAELKKKAASADAAK